MKKLFIIIGITIAGLFTILLALPFMFQGKIKEAVKKEVNDNLNAQVNFKDVGLSFIRNFPNATIIIEGLTVVGLEDFASDTLLRSKKLSATINLASLFDNSGYEVKKILIDRTSLHAKMLENGKANWDIMKPSDETTPNDTASSTFNLKLQKIELNKVDITYEDLQSNMKAIVQNFSGTMKGDMTADVTTIETKSSIEAFTFIMGKIPYAGKIKLNMELDLQADFARQKYTIRQSTIGINAIRATVDGWLAMPDSSKMEMDLKLEAPQIQFKDLLSLIPAIYANDFKDLKAAGDVQLLATVKGTMQGENYPAYDLHLNVANGRFQYPALPKSINDIQINTHISSPGGILDNMTANVDKMHFALGENPFDLRLKISRPMTDLLLDFAAKGTLNLNTIKDIYPLEKGMELNGILTADMSFAGAISSIQKGVYDKFKASGTLGLNAMKFRSEDIPDILINKASFTFNPKYADLSNLTVNIGKNDLSANGKLENYLPYILKDETIKGSLNISSEHLNLNDFMKDRAPAPAEKEPAPSQMLAFEVPKNINFNLNAKLKEVSFDKIDMQNIAGTIIVNEGKVDMRNLSMNALGGSMKVNGSYSTAKNPKQPDVDFGLDLKNVSFAETFKSFDFVKELMPIFEKMTGNYSVNLNLKTPLAADMSPILPALTGEGLLQSNDVSVNDVAALTALADVLKNDKFKTIKATDLKIPFAIANGRVHTSPFDVNMGDTKMTLSGSTGLDQTIDYVAKASLPDRLAKGTISSVGVKIGGTFTSPKVSIDTKSLVDDALSSALKNAGIGDGNLKA
ncbi:MAG: AsmA family protein, partial [Dysgonamonadaceae bacterium]|nr:AsmA family protein [Dysgonamonadaceae bacterium]